MQTINSHDEISQVIKNVKEETGITDHALARKLGVTVDYLRNCEEGYDKLGGEAIDRLNEFSMQVTTSSTLVAPRISTPHLASAIACADSFDHLSTLPSNSIDTIISDIPYGISLDDWDVLHENSNSSLLGSSDAQVKAGNVFKKRRKPINGWSSADRAIPHQYYDWCRQWTHEWLRVLKPGGSAIVFAGRRLSHRCIQAMEDEGFNFRDLIAWQKPQAVFRAQRLSTILQKRGELSEAKRWNGWRVGNLAPIFEPIIWCFKPYDVTISDNVLDYMVGAMNADQFKFLSGSFDNIIRAGLGPNEERFHEAQKPISLMEILIELTTPYNGIVLDPFAGSGTTGVAAVLRNKRYIMIERDEGYTKIIQKRILEAEAIASKKT